MTLFGVAFLRPNESRPAESAVIQGVVLHLRGREGTRVSLIRRATSLAPFGVAFFRPNESRLASSAVIQGVVLHLRGCGGTRVSPIRRATSLALQASFTAACWIPPRQERRFACASGFDCRELGEFETCDGGC